MTDTKPCPECAEAIGQDAEVCPHCGHVFPGGARWRQQRNRRALILLAVVVILGIAGLVAMQSSIDNSEDKGRRDADEFIDCVSAGREDC